MNSDPNSHFLVYVHDSVATYACTWPMPHTNPVRKFRVAQLPYRIFYSHMLSSNFLEHWDCAFYG